MNFLTDPITFLTNWLRSVFLGWGLSADLVQFILYALGAAILASGAMFFTIGLIWAERKILGRVQDRLGPNRVGPWGIFQTFADMVKIFTKEYILPQGVDWVPFNLAPVLSVGSVLMLWAVIPLASTVYGVNINVGALYLIAVGAIGTLGFILAGWGSNNKYALLGAFRAVAQMISYEVPMVISLLVPVMLSESLGMNDIVQSQKIWYIFMAPVPALIFFVSSIAEVGRSPFDVLEADSELVAGFNIEYPGLKFGMFYVGDFLHGFTIAVIFSTLFLGGWRGPFVEQVPILGVVWLMVKTVVVWFISVVIRGTMPRFRIDQIMVLNWKFFVPLSLAAFLVISILAKVIPAEWLAVKVVVLLISNGIIWIIADRILNAFLQRRERVVVMQQKLPVARP